MFRLQDNVPDIYINESRDFQLICRLYDLIINGVMFDINSIPNINNPLKVNDRLLKLYCTKVGFFTNKEIIDSVLRYIIASFNYATKYKGTRKGIEHVVCTILKLEGSFDRPTIIIDNELYNIQILTPITIYNKIALQEYLKYILPAGYTYTVENVEIFATRLTQLNIKNEVVYQNIPVVKLSQIYGEKEDSITENVNSSFNDVNYRGVTTVTQIVSNDDIS